ncbi:MAG TPA: DNA primase [Thermodesulfobacteriota bacterium]|jgi:DNA primase
MENLAYDSSVKEIKRRLSIVSLIENYLSLRRSGKSYVGLCPFHDDKNPSLHVNEEKGVFHCFACGAGGDIFGFTMRYNNLTFPEAVEELARRADVKLERHTIPSKKKSRKDTLFKINDLVARFYHQLLLENKGSKEAVDYLLGRGISLEMIREFGLGYSPSGWDTLVKFVAARNIPISAVEELGLVVGRKNKDGYYDRFRNRIIFPIRDVDDGVVGFGARTLNGDEPKYMNSPESEIYHKGNILYGLDKAKDYIRRSEKSIVVEGYMDFLSLYRAGIKNAVATLGTSLTRSHAMLLKRYTDKVIIVFDEDESGIKAALRALEVCAEEKLWLLRVALPQGYDPDSFILKGRRDEFLRLVESAIPLFDFLIERILMDFHSGKISRNKAVQTIMADFLGKVKDPIERSHYVRKIAEIFGIRENEVLSFVKYGERLEKERIKIRETLDAEERLILKILLKFPKYSDYSREENLVAFISESEIRTALEEIILRGFEDVSSLLLKFNSSSIQELISEAIFFSDDIPDEATALKMLKDCIRKLKLRGVEDRLRFLRLEIDQARAEKNDVQEKELIREYAELVEREKNIKGGSS